MVVKKRVMSGFESEKFLSKYVPVSKSQLVKSFLEIRIKPPLVLKIMSPDALHKTDIGALKFVNSPGELEGVFSELLSVVKRKKLRFEGIMVQQLVEGENLIIGLKKDAVFGHTILFGLGGIFTEVLEDTSIRKCPISRDDAQEMIDDLRAAKIFKGFRGKKLNTKLLVDVLVSVSKIPLKHPSISELDINPFILKEKTGRVVDARIVFEG